MRTPNHASCSLPISQRKCTISGIHLLIITKGDGYCARNSHLHHAVGTLVSSAAPPPLRRLVQTEHHLAPAWHTDRSCQKEVRTGRRKCVPSPATAHPPTTGETTCLYQKGSDARACFWQEWFRPGNRRCSSFSQRRYCGGIARASNSFGSTSRGQLLSHQGFPRKLWPKSAEMARDNRLWGAERIRGELLKLGIRVCKRTIQKYMRQVRTTRPRGQTWSTFLQTHAQQIWACDFLAVTDLLFHSLFAFFIIELHSRKVIYVGVTRSPTDPGTAVLATWIIRSKTGPSRRRKIDMILFRFPLF
jgi:hypothetical protein